MEAVLRHQLGTLKRQQGALTDAGELLEESLKVKRAMKSQVGRPKRPRNAGFFLCFSHDFLRFLNDFSCFSQDFSWFLIAFKGLETVET